VEIGKFLHEKFWISLIVSSFSVSKCMEALMLLFVILFKINYMKVGT